MLRARTAGKSSFGSRSRRLPRTCWSTARDATESTKQTSSETGALDAGVQDPQQRTRAPAFCFAMSFDYNSPRWRRLRERVLRRDGHRCQWAKRYGRREEATTAHHIWPAEDFPEYAWCEWNLISLSQASHNAMHDRFTGRLTEIGEQLRRRTIPPSIGGSRPSTK